MTCHEQYILHRYIPIYTLYMKTNFKCDAKGSDFFFQVENDKSHGSLTIRYGAIIFGLGTFIYFLIELLTFFENPVSRRSFLRDIT